MRPTPAFTNRLVNKRELKHLIYNAFLNYGLVTSTDIADRIKNLTFHYATKSGISLSVEDLRIPYTKRELIGLTTDEVQVTLKKYNIGNITFIERFQKTIDIWNNANNFFKR
jgi:DNA-directed RNA polymerase subunit beta'